MPIVRDPINPKISMWHCLAYYLRFYREKEGLSLTQWGQIIGAARSTVSNMEAGRRKIHDDQAKLVDTHFGTGRLFELLLWFARMAHNPDWGRQFIEYQLQATLIKIFHGQVIPLALQTDDYTWAYVQAGSSKDFESAMARRTERKKALLGQDDPREIWVVIDEAALARVVGGPEVMKAQVEKLLKAADDPYVTLRVIPFSAGAHLGVDGSFQMVILESREVAFAGAQNGGRLIESPGEVRELSVNFDRISAKAASEDASRDILKQYLERYT